MPRSAGHSPTTASPVDNTGWQAPLIRWLPHIITAVFVIGVAKSLIEPLRSGVPWMTYEEDDFFYYLKIAQNLAQGAGSTFNGIVSTNGYHPLWLWLLAALSFFTTRPAAIMAFLAGVIFAATLATYLLSRSIIRLSGVGEIMSSALAVYIGLYSLHLYTGGMEVILTIPLLLGVIVFAQRTRLWTSGILQASLLGLLVSAMVLSRLDSVMLAGLIFVAIVAHPGTRARLRSPVLIGLAIGLVPLAAYFLSNQVLFHTWLPVSGMAKQLKFNHHFASLAFHSLFGKTKSQLLNVVPVPLALLLLPLVWKRLTAIQQAVYPVVLVFPFLYLSILSVLSDWKLWDWYFYSFRVALCIALTLFCLWRPPGVILRQPLAGVLAALVMFALVLKTHSSTGAQIQLLEVADDVRDFAATHPGTYAMGDRSGMVGYLLPQPMVQTEGLVMDRGFLSNIQQQVPLRDALAKYNVRYYVATTYPPYVNGCLHVAEPYQAGPASPHMAADLCEQPAAVFQQSDVRTSIYDLQSPKRAIRGPDEIR